MTVSSIAPACIRWAITAASSRSARNFGKMRPRDTSPSEWPARPIRWSPRATDFGDSTWITRSTAPMSMPSSSDEVATRQGIAPRFSSSSISTRCSRAMLAVMRARNLQCFMGYTAFGVRRRSSLSRSASRSARRRLFTKTIVERCSRTRRRISG